MLFFDDNKYFPGSEYQARCIIVSIFLHCSFHQSTLSSNRSFVVTISVLEFISSKKLFLAIPNAIILVGEISNFKIDELSQTQVNETNFNDFKEQVLFDYNNYQDDQSFIEYIEFLKSRASISKFDLK